MALSAGASWIVRGSSSSLSLILVFPGGQLLMKNIHYLYLSRELHQQEHMYSCNKAGKHRAKPHCFKYVCEMHRARLSHTSPTPLSPAGALAGSQEICPRASQVCLSQLPLLDKWPWPRVSIRFHIPIIYFLLGLGLRSWIPANPGLFQDLRCWDQELSSWAWFKIVD